MFELVTIHKPEANSQEIHDEVTGIIEKIGGSVKEVTSQGEKRLTFHLKGYLSGVFTVYLVDLQEDAATKVTRQLRFIEDMLRVRLFKKE